MKNLEQILWEYFGFEKFREGQKEIIESIIAGFPTLAILPTGGGKSLCYQLPAMIAEKPSIVISPMISLMKDQVDKLNKTKLQAAFVNSSQSFRESEAVLRLVAENKIKLLYLSPEKITSPNFLRRLKDTEWQYLFVDEAHCISEWGHNFRPSYRKIYDFAKELGFDVISAFTATATPEVRRDIAFQLRMDNPKIFVRGFERPNLALQVLKPHDKKSKLAAILRSNKLPAIVYCSTRKETEEVADFLRLQGFAVNHYHAGLSSELRKMIQEDFLSDKLEVIVATNAFGMGIDKNDIRAIIHYNIPASLEHYYQEIGRAGRDGKRSEIFLFYSKRDFAVHEYLIENSFPNEDEIRTVYNGIADYMRVALGSSYDEMLPIDKQVLKFFETKNIGRAKLENALKALEQSGYLKIVQPNAGDYKIQYLLSPPDLKIYIRNIAKKEYSEILVQLARIYKAEPFSSAVKISPYKIANQLSLNANYVIEKLRELDVKGILKFEEPLEFIAVRLSATRVRAVDLQIDNESNERLIERALEKLKTIRDYAQTESCRMNFILKYFGEEKNYRCGICDNCAGESGSKNKITGYLEDAILQAVYNLKAEIKPSDFMRALIGKDEMTWKSVVPDFGVLENYSLIELDEAFENLLASGKIKLRNGKIRGIAREETAQKKNADYETELRLYNKLVELRKETAKKFNQPVYMICKDETLRAIAKSKPKSQFELLAIKGFTRTIYNKFGEDVLDVVKKLEITNN